MNLFPVVTDYLKLVEKGVNAPNPKSSKRYYQSAIALWEVMTVAARKEAAKHRTSGQTEWLIEAMYRYSQD